MPDSLSIRLASVADAAQVAAIYRPYVLESVACFELVPPDEGELARRIAEVGASHPWLVAERDGTVVGYAYATRHRPRVAYQWCTEVSVYVDRRWHRGGVGRQLYLPLLALLALQGFRIAYAAITLPNPASVAFHERLGFVPFAVFEQVGYKLGAWRDVGWYRRVLGPLTGAPEPPLAMEAVMTRADAQAVLAAAGG